MEKKEKIYLTEEFKNFNIENLESKNHYTIFAETGVVKTTFILNTLVTKAQKDKVLYLCNRKVMVKQFGKLYQKQPENLKVKLYQSLENFSSSEELDKYLSQFKYIICDEAHYWLSDYFNIKNFISFKAINSFKGIVIFVTGTPEYVLLLEKHLKNL